MVNFTIAKLIIPVVVPLDEEILLQNAQKAMDDLSTATTWIVVTFFFIVIQLYRQNREIEIGSFKIGPASVNVVLQFVVIVQLVQMIWSLFRILGNVELIKVDTEKLKLMLITHPWFFNPFSDFRYQFLGIINFYLLLALVMFIFMIRRSDILVFKYKKRENWFAFLRISSFVPVVILMTEISRKAQLPTTSLAIPGWVGVCVSLLLWFLREVLFTMIAIPQFASYEEFDARKRLTEEEYYERQALKNRPVSPPPSLRNEQVAGVKDGAPSSVKKKKKKKRKPKRDSGKKAE